MHPVFGRSLGRLIGLSFGTSIQQVAPERFTFLEWLLSPVTVSSPTNVMTDGVTHCISIRKEPLDFILARQKTWVIRAEVTQRRGCIALTEERPGLIVDPSEVVDVVALVPSVQLTRPAREQSFPALGGASRPVVRLHGWASVSTVI